MSVAAQLASLDEQQLKADFERHLALLCEAASLTTFATLPLPDARELVELRRRLGFDIGAIDSDIETVRVDRARKAAQVEAERVLSEQQDRAPLRRALEEIKRDLAAQEKKAEERMRAIRQDIHQVDHFEEMAKRANDYWRVHADEHQHLLNFSSFAFHKRMAAKEKKR